MNVTSLAKLLLTLLQICVYSQLFVLFPSIVFSWPDEDSRSSYFLSKPLHFMEGNTITTTKVFDVFSCQLLCLHELKCISFNFGRNPDAEGQHICEIVDKYWNGGSSTLIPSDAFDFYTYGSVLNSQSCSHAKSLGYHESKNYVIDPDGIAGEVQPFSVYCNMTSHDGIGVTVVSHNSEARTEVSGCEDNGCYRRDVVYNGTSSSDINQLRVLTSISTHCEQFVKYECLNTPFKSFIIAWLVSRDGRHMKYWGGAPRDSGLCACGVTGSCFNNNRCNCDANDEVWREDSGLLTSKEDLPVIRLRFGDVTTKSGEVGYHTLGKLRCYGQA